MTIIPMTPTSSKATVEEDIRICRTRGHGFSQQRPSWTTTKIITNSGMRKQVIQEKVLKWLPSHSNISGKRDRGNQVKKQQQQPAVAKARTTRHVTGQDIYFKSQLEEWWWPSLIILECYFVVALVKCCNNVK